MMDKGEDKNTVGREFFPTRKKDPEDKSERPLADDDMWIYNLDMGSEPSLDLNFNVVSVLPL